MAGCSVRGLDARATNNRTKKGELPTTEEEKRRRKKTRRRNADRHPPVKNILSTRRKIQNKAAPLQRHSTLP
jgi:hypothetical protein